MQYIHTTAYKFNKNNLLESGLLETLQESLLQECERLNLVGTILLSLEGINVNLAGSHQSISTIKRSIQQQPFFLDIIFKDTQCKLRPYKQLKVKIKQEIITFQQQGIEPGEETVRYVSPTLFKQWLDEDEEVIVIDTRNEYELSHGTFEKAIDLHIQQFTDFPQAITSLGDKFKTKRVVIFCTGGVRCEKAGFFMEKLGYQNVYQLEGGIINYFSTCGAAHYKGECFVFDERISISVSEGRGQRREGR